MANVFLDALGIRFIDYLLKGKTINGEYYVGLFHNLMNKIQVKRPHLKKTKMLFHHYNAPAHTSVIVIAKIHNLSFELLSHQTYPLDLAPSYFQFFPNLKISP